MPVLKTAFQHHFNGIYYFSAGAHNIRDAWVPLIAYALRAGDVVGDS